MSPASEAFGWPALYGAPDTYWAEMERMRRLEEDGMREAGARRAVKEVLRILRDRGLLREDRLSYTRIAELEHDTGIFAGSWTEQLERLHEAELQDRATRERGGL